MNAGGNKFSRIVSLKPVASHLPPQARAGDPATGDSGRLAELLGAERRVTLRGQHLLVRRQFQSPAVCGPDPRALRLLLLNDDPGVADPARWIFLDTETTGLAGGTGTVAFVVGLGALSGGHFVLRQFVLARPGAEAAMLARLAAGFAPQTMLASYNGKSYDLPLLATRFRLARLPDPCAGRAHADLLHAARRALRGQVPDFRLKTVEEAVLRHRRRDDLPGSEAPAAWRALLREGRWEPLAGVLRHNRDDLVSLAALFVHLACIAPAANRLI